MNSNKPILLTGAAGALGTLLRPRLLSAYGSLTSTDIADLGETLPGERFLRVDLTDASAVDAMVENACAIVHFGGIAVEADFERLMASNVAATYNLLEAARRHQVSPFIFASSHHVIGFYEQGLPVGPDVRPRPDSLYGASKAACEALASLYADKYGIDVVSLRIGSVEPVPRIKRHLSTWLSHQDLIELVLGNLGAPRPGYSVVYGVSANSRSWWTSHPSSFRPKDDAEQFADQFDDDDANNPNPLQNLFQGGAMASDGLVRKR